MNLLLLLLALLCARGGPLAIVTSRRPVTSPSPSTLSSSQSSTTSTEAAMFTQTASSSSTSSTSTTPSQRPSTLTSTLSTSSSSSPPITSTSTSSLRDDDDDDINVDDDGANDDAYDDDDFASGDPGLLMERRFMLQLYNRFLSDRSAIPSANTVRSFRTEEVITVDDFGSNPTPPLLSLLFNISYVRRHELIASAELRLPRVLPGGASCVSVTGDDPSLDLVPGREGVAAEGGGEPEEKALFVTFDVTSVVRGWSRDGMGAQRLRVHVAYGDGGGDGRGDSGGRVDAFNNNSSSNNNNTNNTFSSINKNSNSSNNNINNTHNSNNNNTKHNTFSRNNSHNNSNNTKNSHNSSSSMSNISVTSGLLNSIGRSSDVTVIKNPDMNPFGGGHILNIVASKLKAEALLIVFSDDERRRHHHHHLRQNKHRRMRGRRHHGRRRQEVHEMIGHQEIIALGGRESSSSSRGRVSRASRALGEEIGRGISGERRPGESTGQKTGGGGGGGAKRKGSTRREMKDVGGRETARGMRRYKSGSSSSRERGRLTGSAMTTTTRRRGGEERREPARESAMNAVDALPTAPLPGRARRHAATAPAGGAGGVAAIGQRRGRGSVYCRKVPLRVSFKDIGWNTWIIAPQEYEAYDCVGNCSFPLMDHVTPTKHAIVRALLHTRRPEAVMRPCCVPTRLEAISILYLDPAGKVTYRYRYEGMIVAECGCR
ncbi:uncharacterized protein LOC133359449 [Lethenteron reissneri]|uniref:uncharacterized protein LOC133359449 n=1 Tax=Lethenteron reissneri TaxID=7753 RepID=UPI002AB6E163|nr:uncharacterized protein LOC133359449 [Lethenteron reissneri]